MENRSIGISDGIPTNSDKFAGIPTDFPIEFLSENIKNFQKSFFDPDLNGGKIQIFFNIPMEKSVGIPTEYSVGISLINFIPCFIFLCSFLKIEGDRERGEVPPLAIAPPPLAAIPSPSPPLAVIRRQLFRRFSLV